MNGKFSERMKVVLEYVNEEALRLGDEKIVNPFLASKNTAYNYFIRSNNMDRLNFFKHIRNLKDNY